MHKGFDMANHKELDKADDEFSIVIGFSGLDFTTAIDSATKGALHFVVKDYPRNCDKHALLLGFLTKRELVLSYKNGEFSISIRGDK